MIKPKLFLKPVWKYLMRCLVIAGAAGLLPGVGHEYGLIDTGEFRNLRWPIWSMILVGALPNDETATGKLFQIMCIVMFLFAQFWSIGLLFAFFMIPMILFLASAIETLSAPSNLNDWALKGEGHS